VQLLLHQRNEPLQRGLVALSPCQEESGYAPRTRHDDGILGRSRPAHHGQLTKACSPQGSMCRRTSRDDFARIKPRRSSRFSAFPNPMTRVAIAKGYRVR
jgi:hypothetical protein